MAVSGPTFPVLFLLVFLVLRLFVRSRTRGRCPLPPGPPKDPLIGHLRIIPQSGQETAFYEWSKIYGSVMHLQVPGRSIVVLNSIKAATDLLDKKGQKYSDRPKFVVYDLLDWSKYTATVFQYGKRLQLHRRMLQQFLSKSECVKHQHIMTREAQLLLKNLSRTPLDFDEHLKRYATGIIIDIAYGHTIESGDDPYMRLAHDIGDVLNTSGPPGNTPIDFLPLLRYFPSWFPGTYYANVAKKLRPIGSRAREYPYSDVKHQMETGTAKYSYLAHYLEEFEKCAQENKKSEASLGDIKGSAAVIYAGGADTSSATLSIFLLAMVLHPECQIKAQQELDAVLGPGRLPRFEDRPHLPYINRLIQENYRWNTAAPLGVPHACTEDDIYNGMFIPKGTIVIANTKGIHLDESVYYQPQKFNPDRYLPKPDGNDEPYPTAQFGFGRRICPGRFFADPTIFMAVASILSVFTITKALDEYGMEITPEVAFLSGISCPPKPFKCLIKPRNEYAKALLEELNV